MKKILLYITFFCLDIYSMNTNNVRELTVELSKYQVLCDTTGSEVEGNFGLSACYVNEAIQVREGKDSKLALDSLLNKATDHFIQARLKMDATDNIDTYFSDKINAEHIKFLSYLKSSGLTNCTVEDTKKAIWDCYLKNRTLDERYYNYYAFLATTEDKSFAERKKGSFWCAAYYINKAIQVREGKLYYSGGMNLLLDNAVQSFLQARQQMQDFSDIDIYFSTKVYFDDNIEYKSFLSHLRNNNLTECTEEDTKKAMWDCYLKDLMLDKTYHEFLLATDNPREQRKEGYFGLAAYYVRYVINDTRRQTSLSETDYSLLKIASKNFIVAFNCLEDTFDEVKKYQEVEEYFSQKIQFLDLYDIKVKHYDFGNEIKQISPSAVSKITEGDILKLMLKVYFGILDNDNWCLII